MLDILGHDQAELHECSPTTRSCRCPGHSSGCGCRSAARSCQRTAPGCWGAPVARGAIPAASGLREITGQGMTQQGAYSWPALWPSSGMALRSLLQHFAPEQALSIGRSLLREVATSDAGQKLNAAGIAHDHPDGQASRCRSPTERAAGPDLGSARYAARRCSASVDVAAGPPGRWRRWTGGAQRWPEAVSGCSGSRA